MKITLDGKCDTTRYPVVLGENERVIKVEYEDQTLPRLRSSNGYYVPPNASLMGLGDPPDLVPDSLIAAFWYARTCCEHKRQAVFYHYRPDQQLIVFPPPISDGDRVVITVAKIDPDEES